MAPAGVRTGADAQQQRGHRLADPATLPARRQHGHQHHPLRGHRRGQTVALTERGWEALDLGERVIADYDTWLATAVGVEQVVALRETPHRIIATPRRTAPDRGTTPPDDAA